MSERITDPHDPVTAADSRPAPTVDRFGIADFLVREPTLVDALNRLTGLAAQRVLGADAVGLTLIARGRYVTRAVTDPLPTQVDPLQYAHGGPCVDALAAPAAVEYTADLGDETRWGQFPSLAVSRTGVRSILSLGVAVGTEKPLASLNFYARRPFAFEAGALEEVRTVGAEAAWALALLREREGRRGAEWALESNRRIGMAIGMLMVRRGLSQEAALALLRARSQAENRKLRDLADDVLASGDER